VYPSDTFYEAYESNVALVFAVVAACVFAFKNALFGMYDLYVQKRNHKVTGAAVRSNAIVSSLFPEAVMERLVADKDGKSKKSKSSETAIRMKRTKTECSRASP
jgi:hypothetical protein